MGNSATEKNNAASPFEGKGHFKDDNVSSHQGISDQSIVHRSQRFAAQQVIQGIGARFDISSILEKHGCKQVFIVSTRSLETHLDDITSLLDGRPYDVFSRCEQHSPQRVIDAVAAAAQGADALISFGGGSVTDTTKAAGQKLGHPLHIAIPTTLTVAEFSHYWGTYDEENKCRVPGNCVPSDLPDVVIHDAELARHTPRDMWLSAGVRAFDHALETIWADQPHPVGETLALEALRRLNKYFLASAEPDALEARNETYIAAWMSIHGMMDCGLRLSHPIGHQIGAFWNVRHGYTSCICLPHVMRFLAPRTEAAQMKISAALGLETPAEAADYLEDLIAQLGFPMRLRDVDANKEDLPQLVTALQQELHYFQSSEADNPNLMSLIEQMW